MRTNLQGRGAIEVRNLTVCFNGKRRVCALSELSFSVQPQEFLCILGTTGCGKSTILNVLAGFVKPTSGEVLLDGRPIVEPNSERGMVFQRHALFPWKTARSNVEFGLKMKGIGAAERRQIADRYLHLVGLAGFEGSYPAELSGGMEQRVGIARALANDPRVLLMDEPFGSLDAQTRIMMQEKLLSIWEQFHKTVVFVTHDIDEAVFLADRLLVLTASPGQSKKEIVISLPRPRSYRITLSPDYLKLKEVAMGLIREEALKAQALHGA